MRISDWSSDVCSSDLTQIFSARAAYLHVGALIGTIMVANVAHNIIPNQRKAVAEMLAGQVPDPSYGKQAKQRSLHNNYLTLPVLFAMISNHYPITYGHPYGWVIRSEEHTSEPQSLMRIPYAVFSLK